MSRLKSATAGGLRSTKLGGLVGAEGLHYVDAGGAGGGEGAGDDGGGEEDEGGGDYWEGAGHLHVLEIAGGDAGQGVASCCAGDDACAGHDYALGDYSCQEMARLRADCEADAEFAGAGAD